MFYSECHDLKENTMDKVLPNFNVCDINQFVESQMITTDQ